jgi:hypothetical protein
MLALAWSGWAFLRRTARPKNRHGNLAVKTAAIAALGSTAYSADTSWRFAADYLDMADTAERIGMFAAAELGLFATALMARQNLATQGVPGLPGVLVWVITGVQVIPAYAESGLVGGTVRAFVGPVMAAMLWHQAMGIELRLRTPGAASHGLIATLGREARERLLSRLGIAARDRDAAQITRDRATARAVALAARLAEYTPQQRQSRRGRRLVRRLSKAIGRAAVGTDPAQREELLAQLAARRHAVALATAPLPSPWSRLQAGGTAVMPTPGTGDITVPGNGPCPQTESTGDLTPPAGSPPRPGAEARHTGTGDRSSGTGDRPAEAGDRGEKTLASTRDRGPGTDPPGDRGPGTDPEPGTDPHGDRGPTHPAVHGEGSGRPRGPQTQPPLREVEQLVEVVRPHVPAVLARDGNEALTRVQLREILRREGLKGGRNDRLSLVLRQLRSEVNTPTTRSTSR